jgi:NAD(P)-dependent dehydrogenase (short-subunit alcohol dehydrogenase family)
MPGEPLNGRLAGKVVMIFGAGPNIGGTCAHFMAREGARIAAVSSKPKTAEDTVSFLKDHGYDGLAIAADATQEADIERAIGEAVQRFGRIDAMIYVAGRQIRQEVMKHDLDAWEQQMRGYLTGAMLATKHTARAMVEKGVAGSILYILSDAAHQGEAGNACYGAAKAGLLNFARAAAMEFATHGIRVNSVSPTYMEHNLWRWGPPKLDIERGPYNLSADDFIQAIPLGRPCMSADVANAAIFLASNESSYVTAVDIPLDGGARAKYWPWTPGKYTGMNTARYLETMQQKRYGVPIVANAGEK